MKRIRFFTSKFCPWCVKAKLFLKKHKVKFVELDVGGDLAARKELISITKDTSVPVFDIGGKIIVGFDEIELIKIVKPVHARMERG